MFGLDISGTHDNVKTAKQQEFLDVLKHRGALILRQI
jgi:hypothetical protein